MGTTRISLRVDKNKDKETGNTDLTIQAPIEVNYQVKGQRKYYSPSLSILPIYWDKEKQLAEYVEPKAVKKALPNLDKHSYLTAKEVEAINSALQQIRADIGKIEDRFRLDGVPYSSAMVIDKLKESRGSITKTESLSSVFFEFMDQYIADNESTRAKGSLSVYRALKSHLEAYQKQSSKKVTFANIDYQFFESFQNFLIKHRNLNNTTVAKQLSTVKTFLSYAKARGLEVSAKYKDFKIKKENLEVIALTSDEFEALYNLDLSGNKRLDQVRDVFCFSCTTGLRYSDLNLLRREHIKGDEIRFTVKKTKELITIPLTPYSMAILEKYKTMAKPLPVISNQKLNQYLKGWEEKGKDGILKHYEGLCEIAGINESIEIVRYRGTKREAIVYPKYELIGVHTGRKTFATLSLEKGMSAEEVMAITGHKDYQSFKRYVKITEQRKKLVMIKAWGAPKENKLKAI
jgi:integrase